MQAKAILLILMVLMAGSHAEGQKRGKRLTVTGTVIDTAMSPVSGALIVIDGQDSGITTRNNGTFRIKIRPDVRSVGVYTSNIGSALTLFEGQSKIDFVLDGTEALLNFKPELSEGEMQIDVGYGTIKRKNLTTDVGYIDAQDDAYASYTNIYDMIQGRVPGVQVNGTKITIRGIGSINSGTDPLLVVDGVVVSSIDNINPREVKSISVLKGSDASIYGTRGANGVILITLRGTNR
jgi:TonB-dependent SusC/RagA subfamily outer membrane receptor